MLDVTAETVLVSCHVINETFILQFIIFEVWTDNGTCNALTGKKGFVGLGAETPAKNLAFLSVFY